MRSLRFKLLLFVCVTLFAAIIFMVSPYFYITDIQVTGNATVNTREILARAELTDSSNIFLYSTKQARSRIMQNFYIDSVTFDKQLPGTLVITVRERRLCGYVEHLQGKFLYIDENGRVLEIKESFTENFPVVSGLNFSRFVLGEVLEVDDRDAFKTVVQYARLFEKYDMANDVSRIDVSDSGNTKIHINNLEFNIGDGRNADEKIRTIKEILLKHPQSDTIRGFVDIKEIREQYVLKIIR